MNPKKSDLKWKVSDVLGFEVFNQNGNRLGILSDIISTGSNDVWVVKYYNEEILIPALKNIVKEVNIVRKKVFVVLPKEYEDIYDHVKSADDILEYNGYFVYED
ncbi:ribosome maturation factor RimM [Candidatus Endomicrobiellum agilis]|jgi:16S rRNA processing protein RimM|uniref:ribosome maturation factor RimM n=1 Tax=Candidatus Endomicrobiellum agilis TaxID=3238957 RepID=UPI00283E9682|nr:PRC-barrel domain-containing protein [Endomicrobium sp.]MCA6085784.1 PRC-barrel domain-containing protein [Endomicrobium sp.]MDR3092889.1 PRC-barrel domain-containing protein [Endomicrobium sp.]